MDILVVIDMQNDFIDGALGTPEAEAIVPNVVDRVKNFNGLVLATRDTHGGDYLQTQEGRMLPVEHCIRGTYGWEIREEIAELLESGPIDKPTFGSETLGKAQQICKAKNISNSFDLYNAKKSYGFNIMNFLRSTKLRIKEGFVQETKQKIGEPVSLNLHLTSNQKYGEKSFKITLNDISFSKIDT